ncbi:MAG TPA: Fur family transcriptional regulator [Ktedonobacterales bacterium]|nr:Fur family transcriptional regulator [Ktedonobacterales bacterium]
MRGIDELSARVRQQGGKVTPQRIAIWRTLVHDKTHPTAEDLYARLMTDMPTLSLATLYHVLNELVEWGEVRRFDTGDGHSHFDPDTTPHVELVCLRCHSVIDAPPTAYTPVTLPGELAGYRIVTRSEQYFGYCPTCQQASSGDEYAV